MTIKEKQEQIIEDFSVFTDWMDKYNYLIELGKELETMPEDKKTKDKRIEGCQSQVWIDAEIRDGKLKLTADSDAIITKGIISLLLKVMNDETPDAILSNELFFIDRIGLKENLSPTRSNGLVAMINQIMNYAKAYKLLQDKNK